MKNFILKNSEWVRKYLWRRYPLPIYLIEKHIDYIDWHRLSENGEIDYTEEFCLKYKNRIDWESFNPMKSSIFKGEGRDAALISFLDKFKDKINWNTISISLYQPENAERVLLYFDDYWVWELISTNEDLIWTLPLLRRFKCKLDWSRLCYNSQIEWEYEWMLEFEDYIDWEVFYNNSNYEWDMTSVLRFKNNLEEVDVKPDISDYFSLNKYDKPQSDQGLRPSRYREDKERYGNNYIDYCVYFDEFKGLIEKHRNSLNEINFNEYILWTNQAFEYILDYKGIDIIHLSTYSRFEDPVAILRKYGNLLYWGGKAVDNLPEDIFEGGGQFIVNKGISANKHILWSEKMLDEFQNQIHWDILSIGGRIEWTSGILSKYFDFFDKDALLRENVVGGDNRLFLDLIIPEMNEELIDSVMGYSGM
jgi:hypothetical protein